MQALAQILLVYDRPVCLDGLGSRPRIRMLHSVTRSVCDCSHAQLTRESFVDHFRLMVGRTQVASRSSLCDAVYKIWTPGFDRYEFEK